VKRIVISVLAVLACTLGLGLTAAGTAGAATALPAAVHTDASGLAGYAVNDNGANRIHIAVNEFTVTAQMEQLNTVTGDDGAYGADLCNSNTGHMDGDALVWTGKEFEFAWADKNLTPDLISGQDTCINGLSQVATTTPETFRGNASPTNLAIQVGDLVKTQVDYTLGNQVIFTVTDLTQDATSQVRVTVCGRHGDFKNDSRTDARGNDSCSVSFWEAGLGVLDLNTGFLVSPAANTLGVTSFGCFAPYSTDKCTKIEAYWDTIPVTGLNASNVPVLVPSGLTGDDSFTISSGITI
jgi:hypothetical protein